jgi:hypothetical protein
MRILLLLLFHLYLGADRRISTTFYINVVVASYIYMNKEFSKLIIDNRELTSKFNLIWFFLNNKKLIKYGFFK